METTQAPVADLVSSETVRLIGARGKDRYTLTGDRVQWQVNRPPFVSDTGRCYLVVKRTGDGCSVFIGRQGMCADIYTEATVEHVPDVDVDAVVRRLWQTGR
jgi:hypothetical protein